MSVHDFDQRFAEADDPKVVARVSAILREDMGAVRVERSDRADDKKGIDFWAFLPSLHRAGIDVKFRKLAYHDVLLEIMSDDQRKSPGWAIDRKKATDYILWLWPKRHLLLPYPQLQQTVRRLQDDYRERFGSTWAQNKGYRTESVCVPAGLLFYDIFGETLHGAGLASPRSCPDCRESHPVGTTCGAEAI